MLLEVSKKTGMWGYGQLWFTYADDGPQDIDLDELDEDTKEKIKMALDSGQLLQIGSEPEDNTRGRPVVTSIVKDVPEMLSVDVDEMKRLLNNNIITLRRKIPLIKRYHSLSVALDLEKKNRNRKTVISLLTKELVKTGNVKMYDDLVIEEEEETVILQASDLQVESDVKGFIATKHQNNINMNQ